MRKIVFINGRGGVGKDSLISEAEKEFRIQNFSSIDPVKEAALQLGWDGVKDDKGRRFLSELKRVCTGYDNLPGRWCQEAIAQFIQSECQILFIHIREPEAIRHEKSAAEELIKDAKTDIEVLTMLIVRDGVGATGNTSDDSVEEYHYDAIFDNNEALEVSGRHFSQLLKKSKREILKEQEEKL